MNTDNETDTMHKDSEWLQRRRALRQATLPLVKDLVTALVAQGLKPEEACKTVRWATHVLESTQRRDQLNG